MRGYNIAWSTDIAAVEQIVKQPEVLNYVLEDGTELNLPPPSSYVMYAIVTLAGSPVGAFIFNKRLSHLWEVHTCLTAKCRGKPALLLAKTVITMLFRDTDAACLSTYVPETYQHVRNFTTAAGLMPGGYIPSSFFIRGELQGMHCYNITREAALCQLQQ
jgi:hypothetical protein